MFHQIAEHWNKGNLHSGLAALQYDGDVTDPDWKAALKMFKGAVERFEPNEFPVMEVEWPFVIRDEAIFGVPELAGIVDLVVYMDVEDITAFEERWAVTLGFAGTYLLDYKTHPGGRRPSNMVEKDFYDEQFTLYQMAYKEVVGTQPQGLIARHVVNHKTLTDASFPHTFIPYPTEVERERFRRNMVERRRRRELLGEDSINRSACFTNFGMCPHAISGACLMMPEGR
jgi:hypothetical protein